jgi:hypothetical protein
MSMEEKLSDPLLKPRRRRVSQAVEQEYPYEPFQDPLKEPMKDFHTRNDGQFEHKGFLIKREPLYQLWRITKDNQQVSGLNGLYTTVSVAQRAIDDHLKNVIRKTKNGNKTTKNNKTSN